MEPLHSDIHFGGCSATDLIDSFTVADIEKHDAESLINLLSSNGFDIKTVRPKREEFSSLACDCSSASRRYRYNALWATHAVAVYSKYDMDCHNDKIVGHSEIPYADLSYVNELKAGEFTPYSEIDVRMNLIRVTNEFNLMNNAFGELKETASGVDVILCDGSLSTVNERINRESDEFEEKNEAKQAFENVLKNSNVVGLVEDSFASDISSELGLKMTNINLFDICLKPFEYIVKKSNGINICYLNLPPKSIPYLPEKKSPSFTVRWEFAANDFENLFSNILGAWLDEDDLLHPQLYPIRIADYLSRRIKAGGVLDSICENIDLEPLFRQKRIV